MLELGIILIIIEAVTIEYSLSYNRNEKFKMMLEIADKGYKVDPSKIEKQKINNKEKIKNFVLLLIPGLNIIYTISKMEKYRNTIEEKIKEEEILIKMTEEEKETYDKSSSTTDKLYVYGKMTLDNSYQDEIIPEIFNNEDNIDQKEETGPRLIKSRLKK